MMEPVSQSAPSLAIDDSEAIRQLGNTLRAAGFTETNVQQALGIQIGNNHQRRDLPLYLRRLAMPTTLGTLIKLFVLGVDVDETEVAAALAPLDLEQLSALGLIEEVGAGVRATVGLAAYAGLLFAHDRHGGEQDSVEHDYVLGVNPASMTLAGLTVRRPVDVTLDVGTGCGVQALLAARHSRQVIAVDVNPRALDYAAFNARLNNVTNIECRQGSLFDPVTDCTFDLIVCNPPYVISPESQYMFRDSGQPGDTMCQEIVRQAPGYLNDGGFASILCNWSHKVEEDWSLPLRRWVRGNGCASWLLHSRTLDPLTYTAMWTRHNDPVAYGESLDHWVEHYHQIGIEAISEGAVILRRRTSTTPWVRADELPNQRVGECGTHVLRIFEAGDYLAQLDNEDELLDQRLRLVDDHRLEQVLAYDDDGYVVEKMELRLQHGLKFHGTVDGYALRLLSYCDGKDRLGDVVAELAAMMDADADEVAQVAIAVVRRWLALGFLTITA